jgi:photosystem II stability/assembly factor-like uncharacterized protein
MIKHFSFLIKLCLFFCLFSCKKEETTLASFKEITAPNTYDIASVWFTDSLQGFVCGGLAWNYGFIASTKDGGNSWKTDTVVTNKLECIQFDSTKQGYVCGLDGLLMYRSPNQANWEAFRTDFCWYRACYFPNPHSGVAVAGEGWKGGILRHYSPEFWAQDTSINYLNELDAVCFSDANTAHAVGMGQVLRSIDKGKNWQRMPPTDDQFLAIHFPSSTVGYIIGLNGSLLKTTDNGAIWQVLESKKGAWGKKYQLRSIWFSSAQTGYIVGDKGLFWKTTDGGSTWLQIANTQNDVDFTDIFMVKNKGWIGAKNGRMFQFEE